MQGKYNKVNWMRAGFLASDRNLTVSPNYASEVSSNSSRGVELDGVLRQTGIEGIVNGAPAPASVVATRIEYTGWTRVVR